MALSKTTRNHDEIRKWAEARGAKPAEVASTETGDGSGILRFEFPKAPHHNDSKLKEIGWEEFFQKFDESDLELVYQDVTAEGAQSNFNKLVHPSDENHSSRHGSKSGEHSGGTESHASASSTGKSAKNEEGHSSSKAHSHSK